MKRIFVTTALGFLFGIFCAWGAASRGFETYILAATVANRALIGFAIGISSLRMNWALHGILLGAIFGLPLSISAIPGNGFFVLELASTVYGFLIELITTKLFKVHS